MPTIREFCQTNAAVAPFFRQHGDRADAAFMFGGKATLFKEVARSLGDKTNVHRAYGEWTVEFDVRTPKLHLPGEVVKDMHSVLSRSGKGRMFVHAPQTQPVLNNFARMEAEQLIREFRARFHARTLESGVPRASFMGVASDPIIPVRQAGRYGGWLVFDVSEPLLAMHHAALRAVCAHCRSLRGEDMPRSLVASVTTGIDGFSAWVVAFRSLFRWVRDETYDMCDAYRRNVANPRYWQGASSPDYMLYCGEAEQSPNRFALFEGGKVIHLFGRRNGKDGAS